MIAEPCNRARKVVQSPAKVSRHCVSGMPGEVNLDPTAAALDFNPYAIILAGDNGRRVHEKREILHAVTPSLVELRLYKRGVSKRVRAVNEAHLKLTRGSLSKLGAAKLLVERHGSVRGEANFLNLSTHIEPYSHNVIVIRDGWCGGDEFTGHTNKLLGPLAFLSLAHSGNASGELGRAQLNVRISSFSRALAFKLAGFEHHVVRHLAQLSSVHPKARRPLNTLVSFCAFLARRHCNHSHQSASYSHAHHRAGSVGCNINPTENMA